MISCAPWALHYITGLPVPAIEAILSHRRDDGVTIAMDGSMAVDTTIAERVLQLLGYETVLCAGGMSVKEGAAISTEFAGAMFYLNTDSHALVARDGRLYDNAFPEGIAPDQHPRAGDVLRRVICMSRDHAEDHQQ